MLARRDKFLALAALMHVCESPLASENDSFQLRRIFEAPADRRVCKIYFRFEVTPEMHLMLADLILGIQLTTFLKYYFLHFLRRKM